MRFELLVSLPDTWLTPLTGRDVERRRIPIGWIHVCCCDDRLKHEDFIRFVSQLCSETLFLLEASYVAVTSLFRGSWDRAMHFAALQGGAGEIYLVGMLARPCTTFHGRHGTKASTVPGSWKR